MRKISNDATPKPLSNQITIDIGGDFVLGLWEQKIVDFGGRVEKMCFSLCVLV